jgi:hypothetical protein
MSIRRRVIWNDKDNIFVGYCDFGNDLQLDGNQVEATEVLVFMLISLNGKWKFSIGYFFQNKIQSHVQAEIINTALKLTYDIGI